MTGHRAVMVDAMVALTQQGTEPTKSWAVCRVHLASPCRASALCGVRAVQSYPQATMESDEMWACALCVRPRRPKSTIRRVRLRRAGGGRGCACVGYPVPGIPSHGQRLGASPGTAYG
eukprot:5277023-Prymnesium_polylepis.1